MKDSSNVEVTTWPESFVVEHKAWEVPRISHQFDVHVQSFVLVCLRNMSTTVSNEMSVPALVIENVSH